jgi:DNA-binding CsgD family transcriptional regulator
VWTLVGDPALLPITPVESDRKDRDGSGGGAGVGAPIDAPRPPGRVEVLVALAGTLPLDVLEALTTDEELVSLERRGVIEVVGDHGEEHVRLADLDRAVEVSAALGDHERREALAELVEALDPQGIGLGPTDRATVQVARWRLELGGDIDPPAALHAGEVALRMGDLATAELMADHARHDAGSARGVILQASVMQRRGHLDQAHRLLAEAWERGVHGVDQFEVAVRLIETHFHLQEDPDATRDLALRVAEQATDPEVRRRLTLSVAYVAVMGGEPALAARVFADLPGVPAGDGDDGVPADGRTSEALESFVDLAIRSLSGLSLEGWRPPDPADRSTLAAGALRVEESVRAFGLVARMWSDPPHVVADDARAAADDFASGQRHLAEGWASWVEAMACAYGGELRRSRFAADRAWRAFAPHGLDSRLRAVLAIHDLVAALDPEGEAVETDDLPVVPASVEVPTGALWFFRGEQLRFLALAASVDERLDAAASLGVAVPELRRRGLRPSAFLAECEALLLGGAVRHDRQVRDLLEESAELDRAAGAFPAHFTAVAEAAAAVTSRDPDALLAAVDRLITLGRMLHAHLALASAVGWNDVERPLRTELLGRVEQVRSASSLDPLATHDVPQLTPAEARVAELVVQGLSNREVADELGLSKKTVDNTLASAYRRLGIDDRAALATLLAR